jgi:hypothetical protein
MKSIVLNDSDRISAIGALCTFYRDAAGEVRWNTQDFAFKFLVIDDQLIIGVIGDHVNLYAAYRTWDMSLEDAKQKAKVIEDEQWSRHQMNPSVSGAGAINCNGKVTGWKSEGFRIETPGYLREEIEREVARLFENGDLTIA